MAGMRSLQLGCSVALYILVVAVYAQSRRAGVIALWLSWLLLPWVRRLFGMEGLVESDPLAALPFVMTATLAVAELWRGPVSRRAYLIMGAALCGYLIG